MIMIRFFIAASLICLYASCTKDIDNSGTCTDGRQNQGEQGIDCGGPCVNQCASCADGIMNQDETAVDCGGQCDPCFPSFSAAIGGSSWQSTSRNAFISAPGTMRIYGTGSGRNITLYHEGSFETGTYPATGGFTGEYRDLQGNLYQSTVSGSIQFTTFDTTMKVVSGIFSFIGRDTVNQKDIVVTQGVFTQLSYQ